MIAADYPFLDVMWSMLVFFCFVVWIWMLIAIIGDIFTRRDIGGWHKAFWCLGLIVVPFLGAFVYIIVQGNAMADRKMQRMAEAQADFDEHVRTVAGSAPAAAGPAAEIEKAQQLLSSHAITQSEFDAIKQRALAA